MNDSNTVLLGLTLDQIESVLKEPEHANPGRLQAMTDARAVIERLGNDLPHKLALSSRQWPDVDDQSFDPYIKTVFSEIRSLARAAEAKAASAAEDDPCHSYVSSLRWLLKSMQIIVASFRLDGALVDADNFNAMHGKL